MRHAIFSWYKTILTIINQLIQFYFLIWMRIQEFIFVLILKASILIICSTVRAFTEKFRRPTNRCLQVALYFLLVVLVVDSYFALFMKLCLSAQEYAHLRQKFFLVLVVAKLECLNIVLITLQSRRHRT